MSDLSSFKVTVQQGLDLPAYQGIGYANVMLVISEASAARALVAVAGADAVGFDTESKPTFKKGEVSEGPHLIQLATDTHAFLFPVRYWPDLSVVSMILESERIIKVGFGLEADIQNLKSRFGISLSNVVDLARILPGKKAKETVGARKATATYLGAKLQKSKRISTSNWAAFPLSERQILYAADDAQVALRIYRLVQDDLNPSLI